MITFQVLGPDQALDAFEQEALTAGFTTMRRPMIDAQPGEVVAAADCLELVFSKEGAAIFIALAAVIRAYLAAHAARRIKLTRKQDGRIVALDARGYSTDDLQRILPTCEQALAFDERPTRKKRSA